jgi:hypothetical protein
MKVEAFVRQGLLPLLKGMGPVEIGPVEVRMKGKKTSGNRRLLSLGFFGLILGAVAVTATQWPEIQRYIKIRSM